MSVIREIIMSIAGVLLVASLMAAPIDADRCKIQNRLKISLDFSFSTHIPTRHDRSRRGKEVLVDDNKVLQKRPLVDANAWNAAFPVWRHFGGDTSMHNQQPAVANATESVKLRNFPALRLFSDYFTSDPERAAAIETVRCMLRETKFLWTNLTKDYSTTNIVKSLYALARLQKAALYYEQQPQKQSTSRYDESSLATSAIEPTLLDELAYYAVFANAAYGWKLDLAWNRRLRFGDLETIISHTNLSPDDIIAQEWVSKTHRPGYFIARDRVRKTIVLCVRGTWSAHDVLTDLCCLPDDLQLSMVQKGYLYNTRQIMTIRAHHGMLQAARLMRDAVQGRLLQALAENLDYSLVLVGHSMGGGVCALLRLLLQDSITASTAVYIYGAPCVVSYDDWKTTRDANIISIIMDGDPFARLSFGHVSDIGSAVSSLCMNPALRRLIIANCRDKIQHMHQENLRWCFDTHSQLQQCMTNEKLVPPGRILRLSYNCDRLLSIREESPEHYLGLQLRPGMFDLQHHVPSRYIWTLRKIADAMID